MSSIQKEFDKAAASDMNNEVGDQEQTRISTNEVQRIVDEQITTSQRKLGTIPFCEYTKRLCDVDRLHTIGPCVKDEG